MPDFESVWVFNGVQANFPSAVFSSREKAESWIGLYLLTGTLTEYPLDIGMYDYSILNNHFVPKKEEHATSLFIGKFTNGGIAHFHYEDGALE
jgi:hypothetical protein